MYHVYVYFCVCVPCMNVATSNPYHTAHEKKMSILCHVLSYDKLASLLFYICQKFIRVKTMSYLIKKSEIIVSLIIAQHFSMFVPLLPFHMVHLLGVPPEVTGNDIIFSYFCTGRSDVTLQTPVRSSM